LRDFFRGKDGVAYGIASMLPMRMLADSLLVCMLSISDNMFTCYKT